MAEQSGSSKIKPFPLIIIIAIAIVGMCSGIVLGAWLGLRTTGQNESTIAPTEGIPPATSPPAGNPTSAAPGAASGQVSIQAFTINPDRIAAGECVELNWATKNADSVKLSRDGAVLLEDNGVQTSFQDCPNQAGVFVYRLDASNSEGFSNWMEVQVIVSAP
jgi:hypothetical protein